MKKIVYSLTLIILLGCNPPTKEIVTNHAVDIQLIDQSVADWDKAWETKDLSLAIKHYAEITDWTNAFGDRVQSKKELEELLGFIFGLDFVMAGENHYGENEIVFISDSIATVRTKNVRKNQEWPDGSKMADRHVNHLRVYKNVSGEWLIINHMISQAWPKRQANDSLQAEE